MLFVLFVLFGLVVVGLFSGIMSSFVNKQRLVIWFKNDLRIHDHPILADIAKRFHAGGASLQQQQELICIYCFDPRHYQKTKYQSYKTNLFRTNFLIESVQNLRKNLKSIGSELLVTSQRPEDFIPKLFASSTDPASNIARRLGEGSAVYVSTEVTYEEECIEREVEKELQKLQVPLIRYAGVNSLYHPQDLPYAKPSLGDMPNTFTIFRERVEKDCRIRSALPRISSLPPVVSESQLASEGHHILTGSSSYAYIPSFQELGFSEEEISAFFDEKHPKSKAVMRFIGGEDAAIQRIEEWMFRDNHLREYFNIRNGMLGESYSSKLSPWLANGCISPRFINAQVKRYEREKGISNKSTYWLIFELIWRDFFYYLCQKYKEKVFYPGGIIEKHNLKWNNSNELIERWKNGMTGMPLVDANMRELKATGWMSNRGRQNVASYLIYDLHVDWRIGADHFESYLLDYDVCSNYGNWNAAAGLTGGRVNKFNIVKQSNDYDPQGEYIRYWCPELANVPAPQIFEPWKLSKEDQRKYGVKIGEDYPHPPDTRSWDGYVYDREASQSYRKNWGAHYENRGESTGKEGQRRGGGGRGGDRAGASQSISLGDLLPSSERKSQSKKVTK